MENVKGRSVFTGKDIRISFENGLIAAVNELDISEHLPYISPGFMDTQVNGYAGIDYSSENLGQKDVVKITDMLAAAGTSRHFLRL